MNENINKAVLLGVVFTDPQVKILSSTGKEVASFTLITTESYPDKATGDKKSIYEYHNVVIYLPAYTNLCHDKLIKGSKVYIEGAIKTRKWKANSSLPSSVEKATTEIVLANFSHKLIVVSRDESIERGVDLDSSKGGSMKDHIDDDIPF